MKSVTFYTWDDDNADNGLGWAAPTLDEAMRRSHATATSNGRDVEVEKVVAQGPDMRRLACAIYEHQGFVAKREVVGTWVVAQQWKEGDYSLEPDHRATWSAP